MLTSLINLCEKMIKIAIRELCYLFPIKKNKIIFINFNGKGYGCNPKYIAEELIRQHLDLDMVWLVSDLNTELPEQIRKVKYSCLFQPYFEVATAKVIVTNVKNDLRLHKKKDQYIIQTWHGSYAVKYVEAAAADKLSPEYIEISKKNSMQTDVFLSNSRAQSECYRRDFWCSCEIWESGYPRNDILFQDEERTRKKVYRCFGLPDDAKIALYAPTFRDNGSTEAYRLNTEGVYTAFMKQSGSWYLLIRMHPNVPNAANFFSYNDRVLEATSYPDMQELLVACEALITDYSSSIFEAAILNKAIYIFALDIPQYIRTRGLVDKYFDLPYPINKTNEHLIRVIETDTEEQIYKNAQCLREMWGSVDDGQASRRVSKRILEVIAGKFQTVS